MSSNFEKKRRRYDKGVRDVRFDSSTTTIEGEGYQKFEGIRGIESLSCSHGPTADGADPFEDPLLQQVDEGFKAIRGSVIENIKASKRRGYPALKLEEVADAFKVLFFNDTDAARVFLESRFYYGSDDPSPFDRLNLAYTDKDDTLDDCLSLIQDTFVAVEQGAHF